MAKRLQEVTATWSGARFRFSAPEGDTLIGDAHLHQDGGQLTSITVKCVEETQGDQTHPSCHRTYRFYGKYQNYENRNTGEVDRQFHAQTFIAIAPNSRAGIIAYLTKAPKIGRVTAGRLYDKFGSDAVRVLRLQPEVAAASVPRLTDEHALEAAAYLERDAKLEECTIALIELLDGRKFPKTAIKKAISKWGNKAAEIIKACPYRLMAFRGCGFKLCDRLYLDLGYPVDAIKRQALCLWHAVASNRNGDTWHWATGIKNKLNQSIGGTSAKPEQAMRLAVRSCILAAEYTDGVEGPMAWDGDSMWVAEDKKARQERELAKFVAEMMCEPGWPLLNIDIDAIEGLSDHQKAELKKAMSKGALAILRGYAGTGKSWTLVRLLREVLKTIPADRIAIAAPTGRAAVRVSELMSEVGIAIRASTIHSLLGVSSTGDRDGWGFRHSRSNPLDLSLIILDELSMADTSLMYSLFAARDENCLVLGIGDPAQLSPVGHGAPLRDFIDAGVPSGELTEIRRTAGGVVRASARIRLGEDFDYDDNLHLIARDTPEAQADAVPAIIDAASKKYGLDPIWDCQVASALNQNSPLGRKQMNLILQAHLNPNPVIHGCPFRVGDKVVNTKNGWLPTSERFKTLPKSETKDVIQNDHGQTYVANGDFGRVTRIEKKLFEVVLQSPKRIVIVPRASKDESDEIDDSAGEEGDDSTGTGCAFDLGFCCTVHKLQGAQFPIVLVLLDDSAGAGRISDRHWLYTATTRTMLHCYHIGRHATALRFAKRAALVNRKTFLGSLIQQELQQF